LNYHLSEVCFSLDAYDFPYFSSLQNSDNNNSNSNDDGDDDGNYNNNNNNNNFVRKFLGDSSIQQ